MLGSLDERFDDHLAQAENLSALFVALNDEVYEIREIAICMIGRLSSKNPAYVMPSLRKTLIQVQNIICYTFFLTKTSSPKEKICMKYQKKKKKKKKKKKNHKKPQFVVC